MASNRQSETFIQHLFHKEIDAFGLSCFRIVYGLVLLCEVGQLFFFRNLIYDKIPFIDPAEINTTYGLLAWMIVLVFFVLGFYTRLTAILNYCFSIVFISGTHGYEYHMFYVYMGVNFLLVFVNVSQVNSLDRLRAKLKPAEISEVYAPKTTVSVLNYYSLLLIGVGFVYFDSIFYKLGSPFWLQGLGVWLPASLLPAAYLDQTWLLNMKPLMLFLGYLTLALELVFVFLFWVPKLRIVFLFVGVGLHMGILLVFPIPWFALGMTALYILLVPARWWSFLRSKVTFAAPRLTLYCDEECLLNRKLRVVLKHFDSFNAIEFKPTLSLGSMLPVKTEGQSIGSLRVYSMLKDGTVLGRKEAFRKALLHIPAFFLLGILLYVPGVSRLATVLNRRIAYSRTGVGNDDTSPTFSVAEFSQSNNWPNVRKGQHTAVACILGLALLIGIQVMSTSRSPLAKAGLNKIGFGQTLIGKAYFKFAQRVHSVSKSLLGITGHGVFVSSHFDGYNHVIAIEYTDHGDSVWLPITDKRGLPDHYQSGPTWAKWCFRTNSPRVSHSNVRDGIRDFTAFWLKTNNMDLNSGTFNIYVKRFDSPTGWQKDFLRTQIEHPWVVAGHAEWRAHQFSLEMLDVESI